MKAGYVCGEYSPVEVNRILEAFENAPCEQVVFEASFGSTKVLDGLLQRLGDGDILTVWRLDSVARSLNDLIQFIRSLNEQGIGFESLTEDFMAFGESSVSTIELLEKVACFGSPVIELKNQSAFRRTRRTGRPRALREDEVAQAQMRVMDEGHPVDVVARDFGVSRATLYRYLDLVSH